MEKCLKSNLFAHKLRVGGFVLATALAGSLAENARAAIVTWGSATTISGDSDVSTTGNLVGAFNVGASPADTTVNGVLFQGFSVFGVLGATSGDFTLQTTGVNFQSTETAGSTSDPFNSLSASYQTLLSSWGGKFLAPAFSLTINNLTIGFTYEFQAWSSASNDSSRSTTITAGNSVSLNSRIPNSNGGVGQFAIGSFVADSATQVFDFGSPNSFSRLDGFQLRVTAVPEPAETTAVVAGLLGLGVFAQRLRRRSA